MNILDENVIENQCRLVRSWRISFRQIGFGFGRQGMGDEEIIAQLLKLPHPTFIKAAFRDSIWDPYAEILGLGHYFRVDRAIATARHKIADLELPRLLSDPDDLTGATVA